MDTHKFILFHINKYVGEMVIMNNLEWAMLSYYVIYYDKFRKIMQWTEKEALNLSLEYKNFHWSALYIHTCQCY